MKDRVIKRDGTLVPFNANKIKNAIRKAGFVDDVTIQYIVSAVKNSLADSGHHQEVHRHIPDRFCQ